MRNPYGGPARQGHVINIGGYTVLEVMLFLAISALIFIGAVVSVRGQAAHTEFTTGANDLNTKMRQWLNQVSNGFSGSTAAADAVTKYKCDLQADGHPVLTISNAERGSNAKCVFLGKVIQVNTDADSGNNSYIVAYSVLGRRVYTTVAGTDTLVDNIANAKPVVALFPPGSTPPDIDLTEVYRIPNGITVKSVSSATPVGNSRLVGFFSSFNNGSLATGSQSIMAMQYPYSNNVPPRDTGVLECVKFLAPCNNLPSADNPWPLKEWKLCVQSTRNSDTATLTVTSAQGRGATTTLDFSAC